MAVHAQTSSLKVMVKIWILPQFPVWKCVKCMQEVVSGGRVMVGLEKKKKKKNNNNKKKTWKWLMKLLKSNQSIQNWKKKKWSQMVKLLYTSHFRQPPFLFLSRPHTNPTIIIRMRTTTVHTLRENHPSMKISDSSMSQWWWVSALCRELLPAPIKVGGYPGD